MSREIFLYSKNKKYKCAVELADSCDHFGCPENSVMILFEERKDGTYIIAQARDKRLETEKDRTIADLKAKLAEMEIRSKESEIFYKREINRRDKKLRNIKQELKKKETKIAELEDKDWYEGLIKQLEDQCGRLLKERDNAKLQLAESEAGKKALICDYESRITKHHELMSWLEHNNEELKQQLAEKDDEIEEYKIMHWNMQKQHLDFIKELDQDKISFAVEQIINLKLLILSNWRKNDCNLFLGDIGEIFDNQIKQLKETK